MARIVDVKAINGSSKDTLLYKEAEDRTQKKLQEGGSVQWENKGCHIIAIGGDKLSRGLTLEGLSVTYYLRPSSMYDTFAGDCVETDIILPKRLSIWII